MTSEQEMEHFVKERNEALLSMDEAKIRGFFRKWNEFELSTNNAVFWTSIHKAITGVKGLPIDFRKASKAWLDKRGFKSFDDGDL